MAYLDRIFENAAEEATIPNPLTFSGAVSITGMLALSGGLTVENDFTPNVTDGAALGTAVLMWSDLFLASGAVINFNNGNMTLTHSAALLTIAGTPSILITPNTVITGGVDSTPVGATTPAVGSFTVLTATSSLASTNKTPINAVAAVGKLTSDTISPIDGDTVTLDTKVYTFKSSLTPTEGEVLIGVSAAVALDNLKAAVNHEGVPDTDYKCAAMHPTVIATTNTDTTQLFAARTKGVAGNSIVFEEAGTHTSVDAATLGTEVAGVDGTVGVANEITQDGTYMYACIATNTIADANWRRMTLGTVY